MKTRRKRRKNKVKTPHGNDGNKYAAKTPDGYQGKLEVRCTREDLARWRQLAGDIVFSDWVRSKLDTA